MRLIPILLLLTLAFATPAFAVDGVLEINQTCAVQTGCFAGDAAGFPVTITATGSYRLTGNVESTGSGVTAIVISADYVSLDLNGFMVSSADHGRVIESANAGTSVANGSVKSTHHNYALLVLGDHASLTRVRAEANASTTLEDRGIVQLGSDCRITDSVVIAHFPRAIQTGSRCHVSGNVFSALIGNSQCSISMGDDSVLVNNTTHGSDDSAICVGARSVVIGNSSSATNHGHTISAGDNSTLINNVASSSNRGSNWGMACGDGCTVQGNTANKNGWGGIKCGRGCMITGNTANENFDTSPGGRTDAHGISCGGACTVSNNVAIDNGGYGLFDSVGGTGYDKNQFSNNNGGNANPQVSGGIEMGTNICGGDTTCP